MYYYYNNKMISRYQAEFLIFNESFRLKNGMGRGIESLIMVAGINGGAFKFKSLPNV